MSISNIIHITLELSCSIFSLFFVIMLYPQLVRKDERALTLSVLVFANSIILLSDAALYFFVGNTSDIGFIMTRLSAFLVFFLQIQQPVILGYLIRSAIRFKAPERKRWFLTILKVISWSAVLLLMISQVTGLFYYFDRNNRFHIGQYIWLFELPGLLCIVVNTSTTIVLRRYFGSRELFPMISYMVFPGIGLVIQNILYDYSIVNIVNTFLEASLVISLMLEDARLFARKHIELNEQYTQVMISQIQPHFLYNTLGCIGQLCRKDPVKAAETIDYFAEYLRKNLRVINRKKPVTFAEELEHVRIYVELEQLRFGDDLVYMEQIETADFFLPALTIQPLVENSVKHGLMGKKGVCVIKLSTAKGDDGYITVTIEDDGAGFDTGAPMDDGKQHIGIVNVRSRLENMVSGHLYIESEKGRGTIATITLNGKNM